MSDGVLLIGTGSEEDGMARRLENGAIVDDTGQWYWNLKGWSPLVASPSGKAPGALLPPAHSWGKTARTSPTS